MHAAFSGMVPGLAVCLLHVVVGLLWLLLWRTIKTVIAAKQMLSGTQTCRMQSLVMYQLDPVISAGGYALEQAASSGPCSTVQWRLLWLMWFGISMPSLLDLVS